MNSRHLSEQRCRHGIPAFHLREGRACECSSDFSRAILLHYPRLFRDWLREQIRTTSRMQWLAAVAIVVIAGSVAFHLWSKS